MSNSPIEGAINVQTFILQENLEGSTTISAEGEAKLQGVVHFNLHKEYQKAFENGYSSTEFINLDEVSQAFSNGDCYFGGHADEGETINLDPE